MNEKCYKVGDKIESKRFGTIEVLEIIKNEEHRRTLYKVIFLNTKNIKITQKQYLDKDTLCDEVAIEKEFCNKIYKCSSGEVKIIEGEIERRNISEKNKLGTIYYKVQFLKTGNYSFYPKNAIINGAMIDSLEEEKKIQEKIDKIYINSQGQKYKIVEYINTKKCKIKFLETGFETYSKLCHVVSGSVMDKFAPTKYKFYLGEGKYNQDNSKYIIGICHKLHHRCYNVNDPNYKLYGAKGIIVDSYFHNIQNFCDWYYKFKEKYYKDSICSKLDLDKDILCNIKHLEFKIYSPETCLLIPKELNISLAGEGVKCGVYRYNNKYKIDCGLVKYYKNFKEAKEEYAKIKYLLWKIELEKYKLSDYIKDILLQYDFSWKWLWENLTEKEIIDKFYKE